MVPRIAWLRVYLLRGCVLAVVSFLWKGRTQRGHFMAMVCCLIVGVTFWALLTMSGIVAVHQGQSWRVVHVPSRRVYGCQAMGIFCDLSVENWLFWHSSMGTALSAHSGLAGLVGYLSDRLRLFMYHQVYLYYTCGGYSWIYLFLTFSYLAILQVTRFQVMYSLHTSLPSPHIILCSLRSILLLLVVAKTTSSPAYA